MFDQLFGSKTRVKLLSLFYNNPERPFYVREITRKVNEQINSVRRELQNLLNIGIVKSVNQSNRLYYEVNPSYKFYNELKSVFQKIPAKSKEIKETKEEDQILKKVSKAGSIKLLFLSGAFVRGSNQPIDVFVVGDINKARLTQIVGEIEKQMNRELNYTSMRVEDFDYRRNLNDRFLADILDAKKIVLLDKLDVFDDQEARKSHHLDIKEKPDLSSPNPSITAEQAQQLAGIYDNER